MFEVGDVFTWPDGTKFEIVLIVEDDPNYTGPVAWVHDVTGDWPMYLSALENSLGKGEIERATR